MTKSLVKEPLVKEPRYWMYEQSGMLRPVVMKYLDGGRLGLVELGVMKAYLRQWMAGPWTGDGVDALRVNMEEIDRQEDLDAWLRAAEELGIDPL